MGQVAADGIRYAAAVELDELVLRVQGGDSRAWTELGRRLLIDLYRFFRGRVNESEVDDLVQLTIIIVHRKLPEFEVREGEPVLRWVRTIARVQVLEEFRQQGRRQRLKANYAAQVVPTPSTNISSRLDRAANLEAVGQALPKLESPYRRVIENDLRGGDLGRFARREGLKRGSARTRRRRARGMLRRLVRAAGRATRDTPKQT